MIYYIGRVKRRGVPLYVVGTTFLKESITIKRWVNFKGKYVISSIIDTYIDAKWNVFRRKIMKDKIYDLFCYFSTFYWFKFDNSHTFSS